jgi:hypothetical protein
MGLLLFTGFPAMEVGANPGGMVAKLAQDGTEVGLGITASIQLGTTSALSSLHLYGLSKLHMVTGNVRRLINSVIPTIRHL